MQLDLHLRDEGTEAGERSLHHNKKFGMEERHLRLLESTAADLWRSEWSEKHRALPTLDREEGPSVFAVGVSWSIGIGNQSQGKDCCWFCGDSLREHEGGDCSRKCPWKKSRQPWRWDDTTESCTAGGTITIASFSPQVGAGSWPIEKVPREGGSLSAWCTEQ